MPWTPPSTRRILLLALAVLTVGLGLLSLLAGWSDSPAIRLLQGIAVFGLGVVIVGGAVVTGGRITGGGAVVAVVVAGTEGGVWVTVRPGAVVVPVVSTGFVAIGVTGVVAVGPVVVGVFAEVVVEVSFVLAPSLAAAAVAEWLWGAVTTVDGDSGYGVVGAAAAEVPADVDGGGGGVTCATALVGGGG